jgi:enamine deaminase RidA (YjgF/YER057c/UK114 family)
MRHRHAAREPRIGTARAASARAVCALDGRRLRCIAGRVATDSAGRLAGGGSAVAKAEQVSRSLATVLAADSAAFDDVRTPTSFVTDSTVHDSIAAVRRQYVTGPAPASTFVEVRRLLRDEWLVEIEAVALAPAARRPHQ